jgi:hypothetical protein
LNYAKELDFKDTRIEECRLSFGEDLIATLLTVLGLGFPEGPHLLILRVFCFYPQLFLNFEVEFAFTNLINVFSEKINHIWLAPNMENSNSAFEKAE